MNNEPTLRVNNIEFDSKENVIIVVMAGGNIKTVRGAKQNFITVLHSIMNKCNVYLYSSIKSYTVRWCGQPLIQAKALGAFIAMLDDKCGRIKHEVWTDAMTKPTQYLLNRVDWWNLDIELSHETVNDNPICKPVLNDFCSMDNLTIRLEIEATAPKYGHLIPNIIHLIT